jgi:hypothetical protein
MNDIQATLDERGTRYGDFTGHAQITMALKRTIAEFRQSPSRYLADDQIEALHMICHKIGRILMVIQTMPIPGMTLLATLNLLLTA